MTKKGKFYLSGLFYVLFLALIVLLCVADRQPVGAGDTALGLAKLNVQLYKAFGIGGSGGTGFRPELYKLTELLGYFAILVLCVFALLGAAQLIRRRSLRKVDREILAMGGLFILTLVLYVFFEKVIINYRPIVLPGESGPEASFPSSHTVLVMVILGSVCMVLKKYISIPWLREAMRALCVLLILAMIAGRLLCGCHWFTDILGGVLLGCALLALFSAAADGGAGTVQS